jgi:hypothetical protein
VSGIKSQPNRVRQCRWHDRRLDLMQLLGPAPANADWEAEKAGWRSFVMGNTNPAYRRGTKLHQAWQRGYDGASRSTDAAGSML